MAPAPVLSGWIFSVWWSITCGPSVCDIDPADDIEDAPTPTALHDLIPDADVDAVDIRFWLIFSAPRDEQGNSHDNLFMFWSIQPIGAGRMRFQHIYGTHPPDEDDSGDAFLYHKELIYDAHGRLASYHADLDLPAGQRWVITGHVVGDQFVLTRKMDKGIHLARLTSYTYRYPMTTFDSSVPVEWMPLVIAYHLRQGHLGYRLTTLEFATQDFADTRATDLGTEEVEHEGKRETAHFIGFELLVDTGSGSRGETIKVLARSNGEYLRMHYQHDELTPVRRATAQEVADEFGINVYAKVTQTKRWGDPLKRLLKPLEPTRMHHDTATVARPHTCHVSTPGS